MSKRIHRIVRYLSTWRLQEKFRVFEFKIHSEICIVQFACKKKSGEMTALHFYFSPFPKNCTFFCKHTYVYAQCTYASADDEDLQTEYSSKTADKRKSGLVFYPKVPIKKGEGGEVIKKLLKCKFIIYLMQGYVIEEINEHNFFAFFFDRYLLLSTTIFSVKSPHTSIQYACITRRQSCCCRVSWHSFVLLAGY